MSSRPNATRNHSSVSPGGGKVNDDDWVERVEDDDREGEVQEQHHEDRRELQAEAGAGPLTARS